MTIAANNEALRLLIEASITQDLKDIDMVNRIASVMKNVIAERDMYRVKYREECAVNQINLDKMHNISKILDGEIPIDWEDAP